MMNFTAQKIEKIYSGSVARHYDISMSHYFGRLKRIAMNASRMKPGDKVLVFCCGTGADFPYIIKKIGPLGSIVGVDFSQVMLEAAKRRIKQARWQNVQLIQADVTTPIPELPLDFDAAVCTLGLSIIPRYDKAYTQLLSHVRPGGEVMVGDMQLATGRHAKYNPLILFMAGRYGGTHAGHQNSLDLRKRMKEDLENIREEEHFFKAYYYCVGSRKMETGGAA